MKNGGKLSFLLVGCLLVGATGCATRGYVRGEVNKGMTNVREEMGRSDQALRAGIDDASLAASRADSRAMAAENGVGTVRGLALGDTEFKEVGRHNVYFAFDSAKLTDEGRRALDTAAREMGSNLRSCVELFGFADPVGPEAYNLQLGERRAEAVRRYLVETGAVPLTRIVTMSFGENYPSREKPAAEDNAKLRQVLLVLVERIEPTGTTGRAEEKVLSQK
jgi:outer membrane protein OmpA-like peptidoglycan-associated protein